MSIKVIRKDIPLLEKPSSDKKIIHYLSKGDIIFSGRSISKGNNNWEKIEYNGKCGYVKNASYEDITLARISSKGIKIYERSDLTSNIVKSLNEGEEIAILKTIMYRNSLWHRVIGVFSNFEGYYYLSDTNLIPNDKGYRPVRNSFLCYLGFIRLSKTKPIRRRVRLSHFLGLLFAILSIILVLLMNYLLLNSNLISLILGFFFSSILIFYSGFFDWFNLKYLK